MNRNYTIIETNEKGERLSSKSERKFPLPLVTKEELTQRFVGLSIITTGAILIHAVITHWN
jgi:hypothetical protein